MIFLEISLAVKFPAFRPETVLEGKFAKKAIFCPKCKKMCAGSSREHFWGISVALFGQSGAPPQDDFVVLASAQGHRGILVSS